MNSGNEDIEHLARELKELVLRVQELFGRGETGPAVELLHDALIGFPWHDMAELFIRQGAFDRAGRLLLKSHQLSDQYSKAHIYRLYGALHIERWDLPNALDLLNRSLELKRSGYTLLLLGRVYMRQGDLERALTALREAAVLLPENIDIRTMLKDLED